jgi:malonate decarboxylase delta subunit
MEQLNFSFPARRAITRSVHVGVVGSGDLEVLLEPSADARAHVSVNTSVEGFAAVWSNVLQRFFSRFDGAAAIEINDFGATPGVVMLRLEQAAEALSA